MIGNWLNVVLFLTEVSLAWIYFTTYLQDSVTLKLVVSISLSVDLVGTALSLVFAYLVSSS